ncbi:MAG: hypothetical protein ACOCVF_01045 [bacterium]
MTDNEVIAKYIGVDIDYSPLVYKDSKSRLRHLIDNRPKEDGLLFDSNWEWLMGVVEIINERDWVTIYGDSCKIHSLEPHEFQPIISEGDMVNTELIHVVFDCVSRYCRMNLNKF